ncbi:hypothetical protein EYR40_010543 [Pleurotus pulmonarius]|nr:hypothetical protein EYR40_010543 [Pleurotus pulmonarius]
MNPFASALQARAAQRAKNAPIWFAPQHANTTVVSGVDAHLQSQVKEIIVHASQASMGEIVTAHFRIYLGLDNDESIQLNSYRHWANGRTRLEIKFCPYKYSVAGSFMSQASIPVTAYFTVQQALECLLTNNRDHYTLHQESGSGCRHWCYAVFCDFARQGWIQPDHTGAVAHLTNEIKADRRWQGVDIPIPAPEGRFEPV